MNYIEKFRNTIFEFKNSIKVYSELNVIEESEKMKYEELNFTFSKKFSSYLLIESNNIKYMCKFNSVGNLVFSSYFKVYFTDDKFLLVYLDGSIGGAFNLEKLPKNIFDWSEEELFYFKLKHGCWHKDKIVL